MEKDIKRLKACFEHCDYDAMREYILIILKNYSHEQKQYLLDIITLIKSGNYGQIPVILNNFCK